MYDKEAIRQRFLNELQRLKEQGIGQTDMELAAACGLPRQVLYDLRNKRIPVSIPILVKFVTAFRTHGVSYGYILDGQREQPVIPHEALQKLQQTEEALEEIRQLLTDGRRNL